MTRPKAKPKVSYTWSTIPSGRNTDHHARCKLCKHLFIALSRGELLTMTAPHKRDCPSLVEEN